MIKTALLSLGLLVVTTIGAHASCGAASWYGPGFHGNKTASGERFNSRDLTAAHKTLRFGTKVKVTVPSTGKSVIVRINDRGPFIKGRVIDLSARASEVLGIKNRGVAKVCLQKM